MGVIIWGIVLSIFQSPAFRDGVGKLFLSWVQNRTEKDVQKKQERDDLHKEGLEAIRNRNVT